MLSAEIKNNDIKYKGEVSYTNHDILNLHYKNM